MNVEHILRQIDADEYEIVCGKYQQLSDEEIKKELSEELDNDFDTYFNNFYIDADYIYIIDNSRDDIIGSDYAIIKIPVSALQ